MLKKFFIKKIEKAFLDNEIFIKKSIDDYFRERNNLKILDVGCGDFRMTKKFLEKVDSKEKKYELHGIDGIDLLQDRLATYKKIDLEGNKFPFEDNYFDIVISNQVLEHILDKDLFISECSRVLKSGGMVVVSTENISSLDNIFSVLLGQEPLSQHTSSRFITSSFLSPHFMESVGGIHGNKYLHKNVCSYFGLRRLARLNGFPFVRMKSFGNFLWLLEKVLPIYNRIIVVYGIKI